MLFLANENFPLASIKLLQQAGHDVLSVSTVAVGASDHEVLSMAHREARIILTFDRDYGELIYLRHLPVPAGVVYFRETPEKAEAPARLLLSILKNAFPPLENRFTVIEATQIRQRPLPL